MNLQHALWKKSRDRPPFPLVNRKEKGPLQLLYERLYVLLVIAGAAVVAAWAWSKSTEPLYRSQARGFLANVPERFTLDSEQGNIPGGPRLPTANPGTQSSLLGILQSEELRTKVAVKFPDIDTAWLARQSRVDIDKFNLLVITVWDPQPARAARVANAYLQAFQEHLEAGTRSYVARTLDVIEQSLKQGEERLAKAKQDRIDFMAARGTIDFGEEYERLKGKINQARQKLEEIDLRTRTLETQKFEIERQYKERPAFPLGSKSEIRNPRYVSLENDIAHMEEQLDLLLLQKKEEHPDVVKLKQKLASSRIELAGLEERVEGSWSYPADPIRKSLEKNLVDLGIQKEVTKTERQDTEEKLKADLEKWQSMPLFKIQVDRMNTEISEVSNTVDLLRQRREEMRLFDARRPAYVDVLETAQTATEPFFPKTWLNMVVAGLLGIVVGTVLIMLMARLSAWREEALW